VVDEATVVVGLDVTIDVKAVLDQSTEVEKFFIIVSLDVLDGLDTVVNEATVVVGLDVTVDVKTVVDQTTEVEEFFIIVLHVLDNLNSFLDNFGVLGNVFNSLLGTLFDLLSVVIDVVFSLLDTTFDFVDSIVDVEEFFIIVSLDVLDGLDTVVDETTVVVGLDVTVDVKTVVDQTTEVEEGFISSGGIDLLVLSVVDLFDLLDSRLNDFGVLSNKLKGFLGMLSEGVLVGVDEFFNSLFSLLDGFGVVGNILASLLDTFFNLVDVEEFFVVMGEVLDEFNSLLNDFRVLGNILKSLLGILLKDILVASISVDDLFSLLFNLSDEFRVFNSEFTGFLDSFFNLVEAEEFFVV
jgi:hypothetical protein